ncbi:transposase family protein [Streptomyces sp. ADI93-02]|uniref:transposase family protein n=1 Tax=Streptomyces sp. ADI93-02 TaxID=1522757 RepID=UPI001F150C1E|nr:transposase family protein [Streptomyces sp. ADI93-02]
MDGTEIRVRRPAAGRKDRHTFISGKNKQNAVKTMVVTDGDGRVLDHARKLRGHHPRPPVRAGQALGQRFRRADPCRLPAAGCRGLGAQTGGRVVTPPHRKFEKNAPDWYERMHERQR